MDSQPCIKQNIFILQWNELNSTQTPMTSADDGWQMRNCYSKSFRCHYENCDKMFYRKYHLLRHQRLKHWQPYVQDNHGSAESGLHGSNETIAEPPEPVNQPVQPAYLFPAESLGCSENLETIAEMHAGPDDVGYEEKRKRKANSFGDDMLVLSADSGDWTENNPRECDEPVAGCSQWADYGEEQVEQDTAVSMLCLDTEICCHCGTGILEQCRFPRESRKDKARN